MPGTIPITDEELNELCNYLSTYVYIYYPVATDFFMDLFRTGCRPSELLNMSLWTYVSTGLIILNPLKGNSPRYFTDADLTPGLTFAIQNNVKPYQGLSLRQLSSVLKKILPVIEISTETKSAIDYMFRYNLVKVIKNAGAPYSAIQSIFGWSSPLMAQSYALQQLFSTSPLPDFDMKAIIFTLTQSGTTDPVLTVLMNPGSLSITAARTGTGVYEVTISPSTSLPTAQGFTSPTVVNSRVYCYFDTSTGILVVETRPYNTNISVDNLLSGTPFLIPIV